MFSKIFKTKKAKPKWQTAEEYWQDQQNKNRQKAAFLKMDYNKEVRDSSFNDYSTKYEITFKGM